MYRALFLSLLAAVPSSTNFTLKAFDFGSGADSPGSSSYQLQASVGTEADNPSSTSYRLPAGIRASTSVATPTAPTFTNPDSSYNRLKLTLSVSGFASDTKFLIAISDDNFTTTKYIQTDQTIGASLGLANYQTYSAWGGAGGFWVLGLNSNTIYKVKVAALQGSATGSGFGPTTSATTSTPSATFGISTSLAPTPPFAVNFSSLLPGQVTSGDATITANLTTNALNGGALLIKDQNSGLTSTSKSYTLNSATADLSSASSGYGGQVSSVSQDSGGPLSATSPYNGTGSSVGLLTNSWQQLAGFANSITNGSLGITLIAKNAGAAPASTDYTDIVTISISLMF
jgi:hypothetical protein